MLLLPLLLLTSLSLTTSLALPSPRTLLLLDRDCPTPTTFAFSSFSFFTAATDQQGYSPAFGSSVGFHFSDPTTNITADCDREVAPGAGPVADPDNFYSCSDPAVEFKFDGQTVTINEQFSCNGVLETASGSFLGNVGYCYPLEPPFPGGYGTSCQLPGHTSGGSVTVTSVTVDS